MKIVKIRLKNAIFLAERFENHLFCGLRSAIGGRQNFVVVKDRSGARALAAARIIKMKKCDVHCSFEGRRARRVTTIIIYKI